MFLNILQYIYKRMIFQMAPAMNWMMNAMERVKMSSQGPPPLVPTPTSNDWHLFSSVILES